MEVAQKARDILGMFGGRLTGYRFEQQAMFLSYANRRRLEIARALATDAKLLLLDEPSAGMNPQETAEITGFIKKLRDVHGYTILVIEHKLNVVRTISDRVIALDYGVRIAEGRYEEVAGNAQVIEAYLGRKRQQDPAVDEDGTKLMEKENEVKIARHASWYVVRWSVVF